MAESLKKKTAKSVGWGFVETLSTYVVRFIIGIILARLLTPNDYGLIGLVTVFLSISDVFVNAGFGQAFIQKKDATQVDANTVFGINLVIGLVVYGLFWLLAPTIADFFKQPLLTLIIRVFFIVIIINSLNVIQQSIIRKELQFKKRAILTFSSSLLSGVIGIIAAYQGLGVWSLVIQQISNKGILCVLLYITSPWRLYFEFSKDSAKSMFSFGSWLLISNLILTIFNQLYKLFIGKRFQATDLGLYERANQFESMIGDTFSWVFGQVAFPVFSKLQDNTEEIRHHMDDFIKYSTFVVYPLLAILFVEAKPLIILLLTEKWVACVPMLKCFCFAGLMRPLYVFFGPLLQGLGKSKYDMTLTSLICLGRVINVIIAIYYGLEALIIGEFFVLLFAVIFVAVLVRKKINYNYISSFIAAKWNILGMILMLIGGIYLLTCIDNTLLELLIPSFGMAALYLGTIYLCDRTIYSKIKGIIINRK